MSEISSGSTFRRWFSYGVQAPLMALSTTFFGIISLTCSLWDKSGRQQHVMARTWAYTLTVITGCNIKIVNPERLRTGATAVYVCNHLSYMDTPVLFSRIPFQFRILARQGLWKIPFMGWHLDRSGQIPVDMSSQRSTVASLNRGIASLNNGMPLLMFPDGGRSIDGTIKPFQKGAAFMAIRAQVPVVPMALIGTYEMLPMHVYHITPWPVMLIIGEPIPTTGLTTRDADAVTEKIFKSITDMYYKYSDHDRPAATRIEAQS